MTSETRARRIGKRIAEVLSELLQQAVDDPRLKMVTVSSVDVDRELSYATIYVTAFDAPERIDEILRALVRARGFLRRELAARIPLRSFPQLRFRYDASLDHGSRIDSLLKEIRREEERAGGESS
ncbi:MAG TPA: 30S ribosome-binding factor RbfA [Anaerolineales bacterium]|nr:30S ribosome-binding factor RbfA [Anaerolineales bacterium]